MNVIVVRVVEYGATRLGTLYTSNGHYILTETLPKASLFVGSEIDYALFKMFTVQLGVDVNTALRASLCS